MFFVLSLSLFLFFTMCQPCIRLVYICVPFYLMLITLLAYQEIIHHQENGVVGFLGSVITFGGVIRTWFRDVKGALVL